MRFGIIIFLTAVTLLGPARAAEKFTEAENLYRNGDWEKARQTYGEILAEKGPGDLPPSFFYNLGTVSLRAGQPGAAYAYLLKALSAQPWDGDTLHNLKLAEAKLPAPATRPSSWLPAWPLPAHFLPWAGWLIPLLLAAAGWQWSVLREEPRARKFSWAAAALAGLALGLAGYQQTRAPVAAFVRDGRVKSGPGASFPDVVTLSAGSVVNAEERRDGWEKIRFLGDGRQEAVGWVEASALLELR